VAEAVGLIFVMPQKNPLKSIKDFLRLLFYLMKKISRSSARAES